MGIFGKMFGKKDNNDSNEAPSGGTYVVEDTFRLNASADLELQGKHRNFADQQITADEGADENNLITIKELNIFRTKVKSATDTNVALCLEDGTNYKITKGTVLQIKA